ncbi:hypothetical protein [Aeromonas veronii]|uniref:hypothetical protein n=1 Tax=Aeromonas veronii TaxID=654 RepID=UPI003B9FC881
MSFLKTMFPNVIKIKLVVMAIKLVIKLTPTDKDDKFFKEVEDALAKAGIDI